MWLLIFSLSYIAGLEEKKSHVTKPVEDFESLQVEQFFNHFERKIYIILILNFENFSSKMCFK